ncbi:MAG TPA: porin, partial [Novosphingobium sp.]|nr:porin [Novosphingobium sp.]
TIKFSGSVNGFYVHDSPQKAGANTAVTGGLATVGSGNSSAVRNGLLPGFFKIDVTTTQGGWNVGAHFGMYPGINSNSWSGLSANSAGQPTAFATSGIDFRQTYLTFGRAGFGEVKIGRDIGLFGSDAILNDITLLTPGSPGSNTAPGNTTLGRIGVGYIYTDFQPQITYTSPAYKGFQAAVGIFQPLDSLSGSAQNNSEPGFQAKLTYDGKIQGAGLHLWMSGLTQKHDVISGGSYTGRGLDAGAKVTVGPVAVTGYYYTAKGLGTEALNLFDTDVFGNTRGSEGFYVQAMATFGKWSAGGSYGASYLHYANAADALANPTLVSSNASGVGQIRYGLNSWVTLISEYTHTTAKAHNGNKDDSDTMAFGGILFF